MQKAIFGAGCFWGVEAAFRNVRGVTGTAVGYAGGRVEHPTYEQICTGLTGHAEVVEVTFDPDAVSYDRLLDVFWRAHDPTQLDRQGPDIGTQYRSAIFCHTPEQQAAAEKSMEALDASGEFAEPVVTRLEPAQTFWRADEYHQRYLEKRGLASCHIER